ncbi:MAG: MFS transporter [Candidatus Omnitrophica bacterium]|nr:MFS transporter [Candidatus Omnitrophota bacterium]
MAKFSKILKNPNFFFLWFGQIVSQIGDRLGQMALIAFVYERSPGSALEIAKILSFTIIPVFLIGPIAGVYVDRWDRRRTMYICDFLRMILMLIIPLFLFYLKTMIWTYIIVFFIYCIGRFFVPAKLSIIPELVKKDEILIANSLVHTTGMIAAILGFGLSGLIVEWLGARSGFYLDALSFFVSAFLIFLIAKKSALHLDMKTLGKDLIKVIRKSIFQEIKEGVLYLTRKKDIRFILDIIFILWSALGAVYVVFISFVQKTLGSATKDLGILIMFLGLGLFLGSLVYGRFGQRFSPYKIIFASLFLSGIMLIVFALGIYWYPYLYFASFLSFFLGLIISPIMIASNTIVHHVAEGDMLGRVFSSLEIVMHLGFLIFMFISSLLAEKFSCLFILIAVGFIFTLLGLINLISQRKIQWLD